MPPHEPARRTARASGVTGPRATQIAIWGDFKHVGEKVTAYVQEKGAKLTWTSLLNSQTNRSRQAGRTFSRPGHMFYCTRTTETFSVRSSADLGSVERTRQRSEKSAALAPGGL